MGKREVKTTSVAGGFHFLKFLGLPVIGYTVEMKNMIYTPKIQEAIHFASEAHKEQKRKVLEYPYIAHPLTVLFIVSQISNNEDVLVSSILHDTVEDTDTTLDNIEKRFGVRVKEIVDVLTDDDSIKVEDRKEDSLKRFKKADNDTLLIKSADILHSLSDMIVVFKDYPREDFIKSFGENFDERIKGDTRRIEVIEEVWPSNPLLPEVKASFQEWKNLILKSKQR